VHRCAERLAAQLDLEPQWWAGFGEFLAERVAATRAVSMLHRLAPALDRIPGAGPAAVLEAVRKPGPAVGELAWALETYFVESGLAFALDTTAQAAAERRARRIAEIPDRFRCMATAFATNQLQSQQRARRAGTNPRSNRTLEINLAAVRDLARWLTTHRPVVTDWTSSAPATSKPSSPASPTRATGRANCTRCRSSSGSPASTDTSSLTPLAA
jgi:hypothetical protein